MLSAEAEAVSANDENTFFYHVTNECYKSFTLYKPVAVDREKRIREEDIDVESASSMESNAQGAPPSTRSKVSSKRNPASAIEPPAKEVLTQYKCLVCDKIKCKGIYEKFKLREGHRACELFAAVKSTDDDVSMRVADIQTVSGLIAADIYTHKACIRAYLRQFSFCLVCTEAVQAQKVALLDVSNIKELANRATSAGNEEKEDYFISFLDF